MLVEDVDNVGAVAFGESANDTNPDTFAGRS